MKKGVLLPEPLRIYKEPVTVVLHYVDIDKDPFPKPQEAQVWFQLGTDRKTAFVPLSIVDEDQRTVMAMLLGERGDKIVVSFPTTNYGRTRFSAYEHDLDEIARETKPAGV